MNEYLVTAISGGVALLLTGLIFLLRQHLSTRAKQILRILVREAEAFFGDGLGELKFASVLRRLYAVMPSIIQLFFSEKTVDGWIEAAVVEMNTAGEAAPVANDEAGVGA